MKIILGLAIICISFHSIVCPPVNPQPAEGGSKEDDQDTGSDYDRYLKEVVEALEEDPDFRKKLEESNATDIKSGKISVHLERVAHHIRERSCTGLSPCIVELSSTNKTDCHNIAEILLRVALITIKHKVT